MPDHNELFFFQGQSLNNCSEKILATKKQKNKQHDALQRTPQHQPTPTNNIRQQRKNKQHEKKTSPPTRAIITSTKTEHEPSVHSR